MRTGSHEKRPSGKTRWTPRDSLGGVLVTRLLASHPRLPPHSRRGCDAHSPARERRTSPGSQLPASHPRWPVTPALRGQLDKLALASPRAFGFCCVHSRPCSAVSLGFPPGGQRPDAPGSSGPAQPIQRLREARGGPRDLPWRRASRRCRRHLSPPVLPTLRASGSGNSNNPTARATASPQPRTMAASPPVSTGTRRAGYWEW